MNQYALFLAIAPLAGLGTLSALLLPLFMRPKPPFPKTLRLFLAIELAFLVGNSLQLLQPTTAGVLLASRINLIFLTLGPVCWFCFCLSYSGVKPKTWIPYGALLIVPAVSIAADFTDSRHRLFLEAYHFIPGFRGLPALRFDAYGPIYYLHLAYSGLLALGGAWLILSRCLIAKKIHRQQVLWMSVGIALPLVYSLFHFSHVVPGLTKDFTAIVAAASGICFTVAIMKYRLFRDYPATKRALVEQAPFGLLLLDSDGTILDANPRSEALLGKSAGRLRGLFVDAVFPGFFAALEDSPDGISGRPFPSGIFGAVSLHFSLDCQPVSLSSQGGHAWHLSLRPLSPAPVAAAPPPETTNAAAELSHREGEVLEFLLNNLSIKEIAGKLGVSENTIKFHVKNIYRKTGIHKRRQIRPAFDPHSPR